MRLVAPFGLAELMNMIGRPHTKRVTEVVYAQNAARWAVLWPGLTIVPGTDTAADEEHVRHLPHYPLARRLTAFPVSRCLSGDPPGC